MPRPKSRSTWSPPPQRENPSGWTALEANYHAAGELCLGEIAVSLDSVMWVQFGVLYHSSSGTGDGQVDVSYAVRRS